MVKEGIVLGHRISKKGIEFDKEYCLKTVFLTFSSNEYLLPPDRHFWDFYPFKGDDILWKTTRTFTSWK